jgi:hypothetical protein
MPPLFAGTVVEVGAAGLMFDPGFRKLGTRFEKKLANRERPGSMAGGATDLLVSIG